MFHALVKHGLTLANKLVSTLFSNDTLKGFSEYFASLSKVVNVWRERASNVMLV